MLTKLDGKLGYNINYSYFGFIYFFYHLKALKKLNYPIKKYRFTIHLLQILSIVPLSFYFSYQFLSNLPSIFFKSSLHFIFEFLSAK